LDNKLRRGFCSSIFDAILRGDLRGATQVVVHCEKGDHGEGRLVFETATD